MSTPSNTSRLRCCRWSEALPLLDSKTKIELISSLKSFVLWELSQLDLADVESDPQRFEGSGLLADVWMRHVQCEWE